MMNFEGVDEIDEIWMKPQVTCYWKIDENLNVEM